MLRPSISSVISSDTVLSVEISSTCPGRRNHVSQLPEEMICPLEAFGRSAAGMEPGIDRIIASYSRERR